MQVWQIISVKESSLLIVSSYPHSGGLASRMAVSLLGPYGCRSPVLHGLLRQWQEYYQTGRLLTGAFQIIMFSDLECDYINPIDLCNKLNQVRMHHKGYWVVTLLILSLHRQFVIPEHGAHAFLTLLFLLSGQWIAFILNAPLVAWNANKYV